ncbi:MAG: hypothetical protein JWQ09_4172 [Segetibacter sp.]|nr:hypothetical protein [Segetibacter sp.]
MKYLPFLDGKYSVAPALLPVKKIDIPANKYVFEIDESYQEYLDNKQSCREENIHKYYIEKNLSAETVASVNQYIVQQLVKEYPAYFHLKQEDGDCYILINQLQNISLRWKEDWIQVENHPYLSLFDALANQVQEDFAICQLQGDKDWMAAIHICSPNHWEPAKKAGLPFDAIHAIVPGMEKGMSHYFKMLQSVVNKGPFIRFAWGISTDNRLNHHPVPAAGADAEIWKGRKIQEGCELYLRVEKQSLIGLPENDAFFFTIRTYFYRINELEQHEKAALKAAIDTMSEQSLAYKGLEGKVEIFKKMVDKNS